MLGFLFRRNLIWRVKYDKSRENVEKLSFRKSIVHEWKGRLEIFSRPQVKEISRQYMLLRTDILQKTCSKIVSLTTEAQKPPRKVNVPADLSSGFYNLNGQTAGAYSHKIIDSKFYET